MMYIYLIKSYSDWLLTLSVGMWCILAYSCSNAPVLNPTCMLCQQECSFSDRCPISICFQSATLENIFTKYFQKILLLLFKVLCILVQVSCP